MFLQLERLFTFFTSLRLSMRCSSATISFLRSSLQVLAFRDTFPFFFPLVVSLPLFLLGNSTFFFVFLSKSKGSSLFFRFCCLCYQINQITFCWQCFIWLGQLLEEDSFGIFYDCCNGCCYWSQCEMKCFWFICG